MQWTREWTKVSAFEFEDIIYEKKYFDEGGVARITMCRRNPAGLNVMSVGGMREIVRALRDARLDNSVGVVLLTGAGDKCFCAGGDVRLEQAGETEIAYEEAPDVELHLRLVGKPVIAVVKGYCIAWGNHIAYSCDFTIAADNAIFGQVGPRIGSPAGGRLVTYLARVVGTKKAREMWMLCRRYPAKEALQMGLVNTVVPLEKLEEEVDKWCREILEKNPTCLRILKASFDSEMEQLLGGNPYFQNLIAPGWFRSEEMQEAMQAFLNKKKPDWGKGIRKRPEGFRAEDT